MITALLLLLVVVVIAVVAYLLVTVPNDQPISNLERVLRQIEAERIAAERVPPVVPIKKPVPEPEPVPVQRSIRLVNTRGKIVGSIPEPRRRPVQIKHKSSVYAASHVGPDGMWVYRLVSVERKK
jgi:HAMP domain-containing protein